MDWPSTVSSVSGSSRSPRVRREADALAQAVVALGRVGLAVVAARGGRGVGDRGHVGLEVHERGERPRKQSVPGLARLLAARRDGADRLAGRDDARLVRGEVDGPVARHARHRGDRDGVRLRGGELELHGGPRRRGLDALHAEALSDGVEHLAAGVAQQRLARRVVGLGHVGHEHGHEGLAEDAPLVAGVERLADAGLERCDDVGVYGAAVHVHEVEGLVVYVGGLCLGVCHGHPLGERSAVAERSPETASRGSAPMSTSSSEARGS